MSKDNKGATTDEIVLKYCTCMNNKMSENETKSITEWEKTHVAERKACDSRIRAGNSPPSVNASHIRPGIA